MTNVKISDTGMEYSTPSNPKNTGSNSAKPTATQIATSSAERPSSLREERIRRSVEEYGDKEENMESFVARKDKQRASYYNYFTSVRWGDRKSYDLCINSALGLDTAVELIRTAALAREGQSK